MKCKYFFICLSLLVFLSCEKNDYSSYCPTWKGFTYTVGARPNDVAGNPRNVVLHPGDSIHLTAHQDKRGHLINATYYTWTICFDTIDARSGETVHATKTYDKRTNYDGYADGADDPVCHLLLPANALPTDAKPDTIKFVARYSYSGQGIVVDNGNIIENTSYGGRITPQSGPTGGGAAGYLYFKVEE
ncbi:MAG: hypothetical protein J5733_11280 [Bacteroidaceae bacterium]|nr:hypothetical protein [Bacteroidaceae bacterium]